MGDEDILIGRLLEDVLTLEQLAAACPVEPAWLQRRLDEGLLPNAESVAGRWRFSSSCLQRARRMRRIERDFEAVPELAALVADLMEEIDDLRAQLAWHARN
ncbi:MAG: MerR family transcriptional regulator [Candidatus Accumulibacter sp.]|nr:MerR family transcriptional regulator [Accumulibacter sp.]